MISLSQIALIAVLGTSPGIASEISKTSETLEDIDKTAATKESVCKTPRKQPGYLAPAVFVPVVNVAYWLPSWLLEADFAQINLDTMRGNFAHGMVIDEDNFTTNQFGHPYQGGSYFNTARTFGLSFWEAVP